MKFVPSLDVSFLLKSIVLTEVKESKPCHLEHFSFHEGLRAVL